MKRPLLLAMLAAALMPPTLARGQGAVVFQGANVIPMDTERVLEAQTVVVVDGVISAIGPARSVDIPAGAVIVPAAGRYLIPGLSEMHAHIPPPQAGEPVIQRTLFLYLAGGVTTIRGMLGHPRHLELRDESRRGDILAPRIFTSGPSFNGTSAPAVDVAERMVADQSAAGYDLLKLHPGLSREVFDALDEAADGAGIPFAGHVSGEVGLDRALAAGYASIEHLDGYVEALAGMGGGFDPQVTGFFGFNLTDRADARRIAELSRATADAGVWNVPTQTLMEHLLSPEDPEEMARRPEMRYMPPQTVRQWVDQKRSFQAQPAFSAERAARYIELRRALIRGLHEAGAGLILGSDAPQWWNVPGFSARRELEFMVASGLTPYEALRIGTAAPAEYFEQADRWGTVAVGMAADLVLLDGDPLQDIRTVWDQAGVMVRGHWLPRSVIEERLEEIAREVGR
jgi:imidazolonepropionase-like amidohydrolase